MPPCAASIAVRALLPEGTDKTAHRAAGLDGVQNRHILFEPDDAARLARAIGDAAVPSSGLNLLIVPGRSGSGPTPGRAARDQTLGEIHRLPGPIDCALCWFGPGEPGILRQIMALGAKIRVRFGNTLRAENGSVATSNAALIAGGIRELAG